jgi:hypothetical protein
MAGDRGSVAGNGGSMGTRKQRSTAKKLADEEPDEPAPANEDGVERFRSAAEKELVQRGRKMAKALANKAVNGDVSSVKALISEAVKAENKKAKKKTGKTMGQELAKDKTWEGPPVKTGEEFEDWNGDPDAGSASAGMK